MEGDPGIEPGTFGSGGLRESLTLQLRLDMGLEIRSQVKTKGLTFRRKSLFLLGSGGWIRTSDLRVMRWIRMT